MAKGQTLRIGRETFTQREGESARKFRIRARRGERGKPTLTSQQRAGEIQRLEEQSIARTGAGLTSAERRSKFERLGGGRAPQQVPGLRGYLR